MSSVHQTGDVIGYHIGQVDSPDESKDIDECARLHDGIYIWFGAKVTVSDDPLEGVDIVTGDFKLEEKPVELGLGQRVGPFKLNWVLGGENKKGRG